MPNFKIIQDVPDDARVKIYQDTPENAQVKIYQDVADNARVKIYGSQNVPIATDAAGNLSVVSQLGTTDVSYSLKNIADTAGSGDVTYNVLGLKTLSFGIYNGSDSPNQATARMQISPDGTHWLNSGGVITLNSSAVGTLVPSVFLKYARVYYAAVNASSAVTLNIFFQGQT